MLAQLQASFNRQLEECSRGILRKIDKMQQQAIKARECATQLNEATDPSAPELSVPCIPDVVKDLVSKSWGTHDALIACNVTELWTALRSQSVYARKI